MFLVVLSVPGFCSGIQIDALVSGLRNPLTDSFLSGGLVYTYAAGTTASKTTYMDAAMSTPSTNPIVLDAYGRALRFASGKYKFVIKTSGGTLLWTLDNLEYSSVSTFASTTVNPFGSSMAVTNFRTAALTATLAADLNANGYAIHNIATPTLAYDVSTMGYVDSVKASLSADIASTSAYVASQDILLAAAIATATSQAGAGIASLTPSIPSFTPILAWAEESIVMLVGSSSWIPVKSFSYTNSTATDVYLAVHMQSRVDVLISTSTVGLQYYLVQIGMLDTDGTVYTGTAIRNEVANVYAQRLSTPVSLFSHVQIPPGQTRTLGIYYQGLDGGASVVNATFNLPASGNWVQYHKVK